MSSVKIAGVGRDLQHQIEDDGRLLLERAGHREARVEALDHELENPSGVEVLEVGRDGAR